MICPACLAQTDEAKDRLIAHLSERYDHLSAENLRLRVEQAEGMPTRSARASLTIVNDRLAAANQEIAQLKGRLKAQKRTA